MGRRIRRRGRHRRRGRVQQKRAGAGTAPTPTPAPTPESPVVVTEKWRAKHETDYRRDWVTIAGLFR